MSELLKVRNLLKRFSVKRGFFFRQPSYVQAVRSVSFSIGTGKTLGLVGESGCGKTTVARMVARLIQPDEGEISFEDTDIGSLEGKHLKPFRRKIQMIFQDPYSSLNPRMKVGETVAEPLIVHKELLKNKRAKVEALLDQVGLSKDFYDRYPHEFSGGQRQRIGIARAIALLPKLIVADEPVSALDVSVAAQIVNLLQDLQEKFKISYLFISHDLKMVRYLSHEIVVMYLGKIVERASSSEMLKPLHPYTQALVSAIPGVQPKGGRILLTGEVPSPVSPPRGCSFHTRCPFAEKRCREEEPMLRDFGNGHLAACHFVEKIND